MTLEATRLALKNARRLVLKVGSSSLTRSAGGLDEQRIRELVEVIAVARARGQEVILVSSGAISAGLAPLALPKRPKDLSTQQAAAAVGQGLLMAAYAGALNTHGLVGSQILLTADDLIRRTQYKNAQSALTRLCALGIVPIVNENDTVATSEIRFGDNDRLAALVAHLIHADALVLLSDIDGLYTGPPALPGSVRVPFVAGPADLRGLEIGGTQTNGVGTGGMHTKVQAATMAADSGIPTLVTSADLAASAVAGESPGTYFGVTHKRRGTRLLWLAHLAETLGTLTVDAGARRAIAEGGTSLLAVGLVGVSGEFEAGDPVDVRDASGGLIARGMVNFNSQELPNMLGHSTADLGKYFGSDYRKEVVHRNDLVRAEAIFEKAVRWQ